MVGGALSCGLFRTFACGSFRSWTISPLPQSVPRKNPNYLRNTAAPGGKQALAQLSRPRNGCYAPPRFLDRAFQLRYRSLKACRTCRTADYFKRLFACSNAAFPPPSIRASSARRPASSRASIRERVSVPSVDLETRKCFCASRTT